jgi:hypothetical protein
MLRGVARQAMLDPDIGPEANRTEVMTVLTRRILP